MEKMAEKMPTQEVFVKLTNEKTRRRHKIPIISRWALLDRMPLFTRTAL